MTPRTIHRRIDMLLPDDLFADFARVAVRDPIELGHQLHGPQIRRGVALWQSRQNAMLSGFSWWTSIS